MGKLEVFILKRINEEIKKRGFKKIRFGKEILGWGKTKTYEKLSGKTRLLFEDIELIVQKLGIVQTDLLPSKMKYDMDKMPLTELIKTIAKHTIEEYLKENNIIIKPKKEE